MKVFGNFKKVHSVQQSTVNVENSEVVEMLLFNSYTSDVTVQSPKGR
jgi:hypothetical protein